MAVSQLTSRGVSGRLRGGGKGACELADAANLDSRLRSAGRRDRRRSQRSDLSGQPAGDGRPSPTARCGERHCNGFISCVTGAEWPDAGWERRGRGAVGAPRAMDGLVTYSCRSAAPSLWRLLYELVPAIFRVTSSVPELVR